MKDELITNRDWILGVVLAVAAGMVRVLSDYRHDKKLPGIFVFLVRIPVDGLAGFLIYFLTCEAKIDGNLQIFLISMAGLASCEVLDIMLKGALKLISVLKINNKGWNCE